MITLTYKEYDRIEAVCSKIKEENENTFPDENRFFSGRYQFPTMEQLKAINLEENIKEYFLFMMYWYTQKFDDCFKDSPYEYQQYKESMKYIRKIIGENVELEEDDE